MLGIELTPEHDLHRLVDLGVRAEAAGTTPSTRRVTTTTATRGRSSRSWRPPRTRSGLARRRQPLRDPPGDARLASRHPRRAVGGPRRLRARPGRPSTLRNLGLEDERGLRPVLEAFKTAQKLWAGERVDHEGTFDAAGAGLNYAPQGADIPVHVGGEGPHMCRMAAKHADGLLFNGSHPKDLAWAREQADDGLADRPDHRGDFDLIAYAAVSVAEDEAAAREAARPPVAFIRGAAPPVLKRHGIDPAAASEVGDRVSAGEFSAAFERVTPR